jgi:GTP cyclohydrolase I
MTPPANGLAAHYANGHGNGSNGHSPKRVIAMAPDAMDEDTHFEEGPKRPRHLGIEGLVTQLLERVGEDPNREGLQRTPARVDKSLAFLTAGYTMDLNEIVNDAIFHEAADGMVVVKDVEFYSMCEHHMLPFFGVAHVAYLPKGKVIGLSKIPRIVERFSRRLQVQERMTYEIAQCISELLEPAGVAVITEARHLCMMMRGVEKQNSSTSASSMLGDFRTNPQTRAEFLSLIQSSRVR